mmetsp:Transcript_21715/g.34774  ORF Transcript_21715/g.34774 Transcript_21715/m.34774 type:complete len:248 (-) Transcript_21715:233-976(-)
MMMVEVYHMSGRKTEVNVKPSDTARHVKEQIEAQEGISADWINLFFQGQQLLDGQPLSDYPIEASSTITMACSPMWRILATFIQCGPGPLHFDVRPSALVRDVKTILAPAIGKDAAKLMLVFDRKRLDDDSELIDCGIENGGSILVVGIGRAGFKNLTVVYTKAAQMRARPMQAQMRTEGIYANCRPMHHQVEPPYAVRDIYQALPIIRCQQLVLSFEGQILEEGRTLEDYGMQKNKDYTVHLVPRP